MKVGKTRTIAHQQFNKLAYRLDGGKGTYMYTELYDDLFDTDREIDTDFYESRELEEFKIWKDVSGDHLNINLPETRKENHHE